MHRQQSRRRNCLNGEQKLRVLAILPDAPAAASTGGAVRAWHFLRALLQNTDAQAFVLAGRDARRSDEVLNSDRIHWCGRRAEERVPALDIAFQQILTKLSGWRPDIIWLEHSYLYSVGERLREHFPDAKIVVNAHNVEQQLKTMIGRSQTTLLGRWWGLQEAALMGAIERRMVRDAALVYCCSDADRDRFHKLQSQTACQLVAVPNGVDTAYFHCTETDRNSETLIFTGTAGYKPNDDAVQWLVEGILPGILKVRPGVRLILAGMNAGSRWGQYRKEGHIEVHCSVPDMRPLLGRAAVSVIPLRSGSGTRLKILEALSSGCAVVSTSIGAEGLDVISGRDLLIADSEAEFVSDVCQLLQDETLRKMLCQHGRWRVEHSYDWQTLERRAIDILAKAFC